MTSAWLSAAQLTVKKETTMQLQMAALELLKPMSNPGRDIQGEASGKLQHA